MSMFVFSVTEPASTRPGSNRIKNTTKPASISETSPMIALSDNHIESALPHVAAAIVQSVHVLPVIQVPDSLALLIWNAETRRRRED
jgi:hypothetical protein